ncbi:hypothetical protein [Nocardioides panacisoli]|uniref:Uncharacterized protein n=1 Tax=Nocardioides panacisoli TaxID=627624 RepID=A0ABP7HZE8_9ACTN
MSKRVLLVVLGAVVVLGLAAAGGAWWVSRPDTSPAPATKEALAAVAVDVLGISPSSYEPNPGYDVPEPLGVEVNWHPGGSSDAHYLHLRVGPAQPAPARCTPYYSCAEWTVGDGTMYLRWQEEQPEEDPGILVLTYAIHGEDRTVVYAGQQIRRDPREQDDLPVTIDDLERLVTDDRFSATTTQEMVETDLPKWPDDEAAAAEAVPTTPGVLAQWMREDGATQPRSAGPIGTEKSGDRAVGVELRSSDHTTSLVVVAADAARVPTCGPGWHCRTRRGVTTGWRQGVAIMLRESRDSVVLGTVRSNTIVGGLPEPSWEFGRAGRDFESLVRGFASYGLTTTRGYAEGVRPVRGLVE